MRVVREGGGENGRWHNGEDERDAGPGRNESRIKGRSRMKDE